MTKQFNDTEFEQALSQDDLMRDALNTLAALHIATEAPKMEANIGLTDRRTGEKRSFNIMVEIKEITKQKAEESDDAKTD